MTSLLTDDKLALGTRYTHHKFTTLRHWGEAADDGAFTLRVADRREGSGDDDDHELFDDWKFDASNYADDDGDDDGVLVSWTLQLYGHDSDTSTAWTPRPRGVVIPSSCQPTSQTGRHGTYLPDGRCEDYVEYKCSGCSRRNTSGITVGTGSLARGLRHDPMRVHHHSCRPPGCEIGPSGPALGGRPTPTSRSNASSRRRRNPPTVPDSPPGRRRRPVRRRPPAPRRATLRCGPRWRRPPVPAPTPPRPSR